MNKTSAYAEAVATIQNARVERKMMVEEHNSRLHKIDVRIAQAEQTIAFAERGGSADDQVIAERVLSITWARHRGKNQQWGDRPHTGPVRVTPEVIGRIDRAIELLRQNSDYLCRNYLGVKEYDRFTSQVSDAQKGYGPRHGHIWFALSYTAPYSDPENLPTEDERIACIRYLTAIRDNPALMGGE